MQQERCVGLVLALLTGLFAGCAPTPATHVDEPGLQESTQALSGSEPYLVRDLNRNGAGSRPERGAAVAQGTLFFARDTHNGHSELWKSDGTHTGTVRVKSFESGSSLELLGAVGATVFIQDLLRSTLWASNGTEYGTTLLTPVDSNTGMGKLSQVMATAVMNGRIYLLTHRELWVSDGTLAGTRLLKSLPGDGLLSTSNRMAAVNGMLFFTSHAASGGLELWRSDGTLAGTVMLKELSNEQTATRSVFAELVAVNSTLFFRARADTGDWSLWRSDGTAPGTIMLKGDFQDLTELKTSGGRLFFVSSNALWTSDGTKNGTMSLARFTYAPSALMVTNEGIIFSARSGDLGVALWRSNGTEVGTTLLKNCPGSFAGPSTLNPLASAKGMAFFTLRCEAHDEGLWKSDGTLAGTVRVTDTSLRIGTTTYPTKPAVAVDVNGTLFFWADDGLHGTELWKTDGLATGTVLVRDIEPALAGSDPRDFVAMGNTLFFVADDGHNSRGLWKSDGTSAGTVFLKTFDTRSDTNHLTLVKGTLFFVLEGGTLWKSDGTAAGTEPVKYLSSSTSGYAEVSSLIDFGGTLFFSVWGENRLELWKSDGTEAGTVLVKAQPPPSPPGSRISNPVVMNENLFFTIGNMTNHVELWKSDGTEAGTVFVKTLIDITEPYHRGWVRSAVVANGKLFLLTVEDTDTLWLSDGTPSGTVQLPDVTERTHPVALAQVGGSLMVMSAEREGLALWKSDGTVEGTKRLRVLVPGQQASFVDVKYSANVRGRLYFSLHTPSQNDLELWRSDGTAQGTGLVQPLTLGVGYNQTLGASYFAEAGGRLFFAHNGGQGRELWALPLAPVDCPSPTLSVEATGPEGALVQFPSVRRAEDVDPSLPISYSHASGSLFPLGTTPVTLTASDPAYPATTCTFSVVVQDTTSPKLLCPDTVVVETSDDKVNVQYPPATASDSVSTPTLEYSQPSGSSFPVGTTTVRVTATDAAGNKNSCSFKVDVNSQGCGCGSTSPAAALGWLLALIPWVMRRRLGSSR